MSSTQAGTPSAFVRPEDPGTTALITGASRGLGLEVARQLAALGVRVLIAARQAERAAEAAADINGVTAYPAALDIADATSVDAAADAIARDPGRLDILINNAAARPDRAETVSGADLDASAATLDVDLYGTWRMIQAFLPLLRRSAHPRIVNVSSGAGSHTDPDYGFAVSGGAFASHAIGKAAENAMTGVLAAELSNTPVMVNAVCPGVTASRTGVERPGMRSVSDSAPSVLWAALLPDDGPRGGFFRDGQPLGW